jgi:hypothetical protein
LNQLCSDTQARTAPQLLRMHQPLTIQPLTIPQRFPDMFSVTDQAFRSCADVALLLEQYIRDFSPPSDQQCCHYADNANKLYNFGV